MATFPGPKRSTAPVFDRGNKEKGIFLVIEMRLARKQTHQPDAVLSTVSTQRGHIIQAILNGGTQMGVRSFSVTSK